jgi:hypothetical protein
VRIPAGKLTRESGSLVPTGRRGFRFWIFNSTGTRASTRNFYLFICQPGAQHLVYPREMRNNRQESLGKLVPEPAYQAIKLRMNTRTIAVRMDHTVSPVDKLYSLLYIIHSILFMCSQRWHLLERWHLIVIKLRTSTYSQVYLIPTPKMLPALVHYKNNCSLRRT